MRFTKVGEFDVVARITGPQHHYLGLVISDEGDQSPFVAEIAKHGITWVSMGSDPQLDSRSAAIPRGIKTANERLGTLFRASRVRLIVSDPPIAAIYESLAEKLVEHVARERSRDVLETASFDKATERRIQHG